jgi:hypothetical protein
VLRGELRRAGPSERDEARLDPTHEHLVPGVEMDDLLGVVRPAVACGSHDRQSAIEIVAPAPRTIEVNSAKAVEQLMADGGERGALSHDGIGAGEDDALARNVKPTTVSVRLPLRSIDNHQDRKLVG